MTILLTSTICFAQDAFVPTNFTDLYDTPDSYTGEAGQCTVVKGTEDGLEFAACGLTAADFDTSQELADILTDETGSGAGGLFGMKAVFSIDPLIENSDTDSGPTIIGKVQRSAGAIGGILVADDDCGHGDDGKNWFDDNQSRTEFCEPNSPLYPLPVTFEDFVIHPASSTDNAVTRFDGTSGQIQDSGASIDDSGNITANNLSGTNTGDQSLASYVVGPASSTDNAVARFNSTTGKLIQNSGVLIDDQANITTTGSLDIGGTLTVGTLTTAVPNSRFRVGVTDTDKKGLVVQMPAGTTETAFEIQNSTGVPKAKFSTTGNGALVLNYSGTMAPATYPGFVLSVQNIGDSGEGSWIEILNSGGANQGAFFGMAGNQFQLFNWQGGDIEFWTHPSASNGYPRFTISDSGNFAFDGTDQYVWAGGYGGGVGVLAIRNAKTVPTTSVADVGFIYADAGSLWTMDSDTTKTRLGTRVVALTDGATPALNAKLGDVFTLSAAGDRTIAVPSNPISGQRIIIRHTASGANRTLALNTGAGGFRFGTSITGLTITTSGLTDYIECVYNATASKWDVINYQKGF